MTAKLTLKQAHRIVKQIDDKLKTSQFDMLREPSIKLSVYSSKAISVLVQEARDEFINKFYHTSNLIECKYAIREAIGKANEKNGINTLLTSEAAIKEELKMFIGVATFTGCDSNALEIITKKMSRLKEINTTSEVPNPAFDDVVFMEKFLSNVDIAILSSRIHDMKKKLSEISDKCAALNITTEIEMNDKHIKFLTDNNMI